MALVALVLAFGRTGGNIMPFTISIAPSGRVTASGPAPDHVATVSKARLAMLDRAVRAADVSTLPVATNCPGTNPDVAWELIRLGGRTVRVHGACVTRFTRLWDAMNRAVTP